MASNQTLIEQENRRNEERDAVAPVEAPPVAQVREDDLEPHAGLRYIARLFKVLALLLAFMLIAEIVIGFRQQGGAAVGTLLIEATRLVVFAGFLWGAGDMALMLIESNHDLRATRILLGRVGARLERLIELQSPARQDQSAPPPLRDQRAP